MTVIQVNTLDGVPPAHQQVIFEAMKRCTNSQRLAVCLYLMSDLPVSRHHLSDIERELRLIFPPATRSGKTPDAYEDFQASTIRFYFNAEKRDIPDLAERLWARLRRGHWKNTDLGNRAAVQILRSVGVVVDRGGLTLHAADAPLPDATRAFLEKEVVSEPPTEVEPTIDAPLEDENLLAHIDRLLTTLPAIDVQRLREGAAPSVQVAGTPADVQNVVRGLMDRTSLYTATLTLTIDSRGWRVDLRGN